MCRVHRGKAGKERKREKKLFCTTGTEPSTALSHVCFPPIFPALFLSLSLSDGRLPVCSTFFIPLANPTSSLAPSPHTLSFLSFHNSLFGYSVSSKNKMSLLKQPAPELLLENKHEEEEEEVNSVIMKDA